jgi:hypothetical protein
VQKSKPMQQATDQRFIVAFTKYFAKKTKITVNETEYTSDQVTSAVQGRVDTQVNVETTRGLYAQAVAAAKAEVASTKPLYDGAKQIVLARYASNPAVLSEFGLVAKKKAGPKDVAAKQAAIVQMQATRVARHTMGARQKEKIKGVVAPASSDASVSTPSVAQAPLASVGSNPVGAAVASVGSTVTTPLAVTGH